MSLINKSIIILILFLPKALYSLDTWIGWNLGSVSLTHDYLTKDNSWALDLVGIKIFDEDIHLGVNSTIISIASDLDDFYSLSIVPTEIFFSPLRFGEISSIDIYAKGEIEKIDSEINPKFSFGIRCGINFRPQQKYLYYTPNGSIQAIGTTEPDYYGKIGIDLDYGFAVLGLAIMPVAIISSISENVREDYQNNDPYYDENDPFYESDEELQLINGHM